MSETEVSANIVSFEKNKIIDASWLNSVELNKIFQAYLVKGDEVRVVGGAPRNHLLGKPVKDIDLATIYTPEEIISKAKQAKIKYIPTGIEHGTITLVVNDKSFEMTTLREDVETDGRRAIVKFGTDWEKDASRRDFTINALYVCKDGTIHDPLGTGLTDLNNKTLRFIGTAEQRIKEDFLRSLRFYRFAATYTKPPFNEEAIKATISQRAGLRSLSPERIKSELFQILSAPEPNEIVKILYKNGLLTQLLGTAPNLLPFINLCSLENQLNNPIDPALKLAILAAWHRDDQKKLGKRFRLSKQEARQIELKVIAQTLPAETIFSENKKLAHNEIRFKFGKEDYKSILISAISLGRVTLNGHRLVQTFEEIENTEVKSFPIKGSDLLEAGYEAGPEMGKIIDDLTELWLQSKMQLSKAQLIQSLKN